MRLSDGPPDFWRHRWGWALWLLPLTAVYGVLVVLRRALYRAGLLPTHRLPAVVIVVGGRVAGGSGKTPTVIALAQRLSAWGYAVGVVSRGWGREGHAVHEVGVDDAARVVGDEPLLIKRRCAVPVVVGDDRDAAARTLLSNHPTVRIIVCDDGLQHLALARDFEVVVFDERGAGNGWLLPSGPLREGLRAPSQALRQWTVYNSARASTSLPGFIQTRRLCGLLTYADWRAGPPADALAQASLPELPAPLREAPEVWAVAGIAVPQRFFSQLEALGLHPITRALSDHDPWSHWPWPEHVAHVIVTEKDAVKIDALALARERPLTQVWVAPLESEIEASFWDALGAALASRRP